LLSSGGWKRGESFDVGKENDDVVVLLIRQTTTNDDLPTSNLAHLFIIYDGED
jgi:hypothetical protein